MQKLIVIAYVEILKFLISNLLHYEAGLPL